MRRHSSRGEEPVKYSVVAVADSACRWAADAHGRLRQYHRHVICRERRVVRESLFPCSSLPPATTAHPQSATRNPATMAFSQSLHSNEFGSAADYEILTQAHSILSRSQSIGSGLGTAEQNQGSPAIELGPDPLTLSYVSSPHMHRIPR